VFSTVQHYIIKVLYSIIIADVNICTRYNSYNSYNLQPTCIMCYAVARRVIRGIYSVPLYPALGSMAHSR